MCFILIIEGEEIKLGSAGQAVVEVGASGALRVTLSAGTAGIVAKVRCRAGLKAISIEQVELAAIQRDA